jgi:predicted transcriptional regulator
MDDFDARRASLDLVTAFVNNNKLSAAELPTLLGDVFKAISGFEIQAKETVELTGTQAEIVAEPEAAPAPETKPAATPAAPAKATKAKASAPKPAPKASAANKPAVSIEESLADPNIIVSLITGEKFKMLRRHLTKHGLTESEYRVRFNLPDDYPMVAPAYAELRRDLATRMHASSKDVGAGSKPADAPAPAVTEEVAKPVKAKAASSKSTSKKKAASPKKAAGAETAAAPKAPARRPAAANAAQVSAADAVPARPETPNASPASASEAESTPQSEPAKAANTPKKAAAKKPAPKRRMARQPAAETTSADATATPAPVEASEVTEAGPAAAPAAAKPTKGRSRKSSGGAAMPEDGAKAKPARKARKTLTPAYR